MSTSVADQLRDYFDVAGRQQGAVDIAAVFRRVEERQVTVIDIPHVDEPTAKVRRWWVGGLAAAAVAVLVVAGLVATRSSEQTDDPDGTPQRDPTSSASDVALSVMDEYFERYRVGDVAGVLNLFAPDATFSDQWGDSLDEGDEYTREFVEMLLEWNFAQGTKLIDPTCSDSGQPVPPSTRPGSTRNAVTVVCVFGDHQAPTQAAGRDPVPITLTAVISADGIHDWNRVLGQPDFVTCCQDFVSWVAANHPDDLAAIDYGTWTSVGEARASGELTARLAEEWAATVEANDTDESAPSESTDPPAAPQVVLSMEGAAADSPTALVTQAVTPSSIGDLRWTAISVDPALLVAGGIVPTPAGFAAVASDGQLLLSDDAIEWRSVVSPFPGRLEAVSQFGSQGPLGWLEPGNQFGIDTTEGQWVSSDFVTWNRNEGNPPQAPVPPALAEWITETDLLEVAFFSDVETPDGAQLVHAVWGLDWHSLMMRVGGDALQQRLADGLILGDNSWDAATGIVCPYLYETERAAEFGENGQLSDVQIRLSVSGTVDDWIIELEDVARGESIGTITGSLPALDPEDSAEKLSGLTLDDIAELLATRSRIGAHFLLSENGLELVEPPPWVSLPGGSPKFVMSGDELYAFFDSGAWRSSDARTWQTLDTEQVPTSHKLFPGPGGVLVAATNANDAEREGEPVLLRSDDGVNWAPPSQPPVLGQPSELPFGPFWFSRLVATEFGFVFLVYETELALWTSSDGDIWERVDTPIPLDLGDPTQDFAAQVALSSSGNIAVLAGVRSDDLPAPTTAYLIEGVATQ